MVLDLVNEMRRGIHERAGATALETGMHRVLIFFALVLAYEGLLDPLI